MTEHDADTISALRERADHYRTSVEMARHISWTADPQGAILTVSARWEDVTGIGRDQALGRGWIEALDPRDIASTLQAWDHALHTATPIDVEYRLRTSGGGYRWFRSYAAPRLDADGAVIRWYGTLENIDDRQQAKQALLASEERFRLAAEAAGIGIWDYDAVNDRREWSDDFRAMLGLPRDVSAEIATARGLVVAEDRPLLQQLVDSIGHRNVAPRFDVTVRIRRADTGALRWMQTGGWRLRAANGRIERVLVTIRDVTDQRTAEQRIRWTAEHDALTGLANRAAFNRLLEEAIARSERGGGALTLALFDVDHLKDTNDTVGHDAGDLLLRTIAARLTRSLGDDAVVARLGGDEFAVIVDVDDDDRFPNRLTDALRALRQPVESNGVTLDCQATAGAASFPHDAQAADDLLKAADIALYAGKARARGTLSQFRSEMRSGLQRRASMLSVARTVVRDDRVLPFYQPKVTLGDRRVAGFEALLRWRHDTLGIQGPDTIAAAFDDITAASALGERMLECVCADMAAWRERGLTLQRVAVNLSPAELRRDDLFDRVMGQLARYRLPAAVLEIEVTETVFLGRGADLVGQTLTAFNRAGVSIALDDFGTGYASLKHLREFPVDVIKIDRSFVADLATDTGNAAIVDAVLGLARRLGMQVVAEGVETEEQAAWLLAPDCDRAQGYLFGRAMPAHAAASLLAAA